MIFTVSYSSQSVYTLFLNFYIIQIDSYSICKAKNGFVFNL